MSIQLSKKAWDKKVYSFNYFDLIDSDVRKAELDKYFIGKARPETVVLKDATKLKIKKGSN